VWIAVGHVLMALSYALTQLVIIAAVFFSFAGVPVSELFTLARERLVARGNTKPGFPLAALRAAFSLGYAVFPLAIGLVVQRVGLVSSLPILAVPFLAAGGIVAMKRAPHPREAAPRTGGAWTSRTILFGVSFGLIFTIDAVRTAFLAVFLDQELHASASQIGLLIGLVAALNVVLMPLAGALADRVGALRLVAAGTLIGIVCAAATTAVSSIGAAIAIQLVYSLHTASIFVVGTLLAQRLVENRPALGMSIFTSSYQAAICASALGGGALAHALGWRTTFGVSAITGTLGVVGLIASSRSR
jgi:SET family sugar efflux transporter-like MFS transporter